MDESPLPEMSRASSMKLSALSTVLLIWLHSSPTSLQQIFPGGQNHGKTTLTGTVVGVDVTSMEKLWNVFQANGNIAFAYGFTIVMVEIQDTLKSSPPENKAMKKSTLTGIMIITLFYASCGILGYEAFGNEARGNFLTGFGFYEPYWLIDIGNIFIIVHLVGAYQVFAQPIFSLVENLRCKRWGVGSLMTKLKSIL